MRTTIELSEEQRAELLHLAAKRGMKGFSQLIQTAVNLYLREQCKRTDFVEAALSLKGTLKGKAAEEFSACVGELRSSWR